MNFPYWHGRHPKAHASIILLAAPATRCRVQNCSHSTGRDHEGLCEPHYTKHVGHLRAAVTRHPGSGPRILVVDDHEFIRSGYVNRLRRMGDFDIRETGSSFAAIQAVRDELPDIITTDMMRPVMDGCETVQRIRQIKGADKAWIIAVSRMFANPRRKEQALAVGCDECLIKPLDRESFREAIIAGLNNLSLDQEWVARTAARAVGEGLVQLGIAYTLKAGGCFCATCESRVRDSLLHVQEAKSPGAAFTAAKTLGGPI